MILPGSPVTRMVVAACLLLVQSLVLYWPSPPDVPVAGLIPHLDKLVHLGVFALPTAARVVALRRWGPAVAAMVLQASVSEAVQGAFIPGRGADPLDLVADLAGVALGVAASRGGGVRAAGGAFADSAKSARPPSLD